MKEDSSKETSVNKNSIELSKEQREELEAVMKKGQASAHKMQHAQVLLQT